MRVIAGKYRRRQLKEVGLDSTRSTKDRVKETMFSMLGPLESYTAALDLFAGSGALGIEALSRGVTHATFVEKQPQAFLVMKENINALSILNATQHKDDALMFLRTTTATFDVIILDPPYTAGMLDEALELIAKKNLLQPHGIMVSLTHKSTDIRIPEGFTLKKDRRVGITNITFYEWSEQA